VQLEPAAGSSGVYGLSGTVAEFLEAQGTAPYLAAVALYYPLVAGFGARIDALVDFEHTEPREFWRRAAREALAETGFDANPLIARSTIRMASDAADRTRTIPPPRMSRYWPGSRHASVRARAWPRRPRCSRPDSVTRLTRPAARFG
jgi:hypothetical protein